MPKIKYTDERIIGKLREVEVILAQGNSSGQPGSKFPLTPLSPHAPSPRLLPLSHTLFWGEGGVPPSAFPFFLCLLK